MKTIFFNGRVITPYRLIDNGGVEVYKDKIIKIFKGDSFEKSEGDYLIDCKRNYISPGFIDIHIHGAGMADFMDGTLDSVKTIVKITADHGTTSLLGTTLSQSHELVAKALDNINIAMNKDLPGSKILGAHLESNYFAVGQKGAQNPAYIYSPKQGEYEDYLSRVNVRLVSAAPEIKGALEMASDLQKRGITVSIGHTCAKYEEIVAAIEAGFTHVTHAYNGMNFYNNTNYYPEMGTCESIMARDELTIEVIADGKHVAPSMLQHMYRVKGAERMHAVSDAVIAGAPEGEYSLGGLETIVTDGVCMLKDRTSFAGSIATADVLLDTLYKKAAIPLCDAVKMLTSTPARVIGLQGSKGRLVAGYDADINVFNEDIKMLTTMIMGKMHRNVL